MNTPFFIVINPIIAIIMAILFYFVVGNVYELPIQEAVAIPMGVILFFILVIPCYFLTIIFLHFKRKKLAIYFFIINILFSFGMTCFLISVHFLRVHFPIEIVKHLMVSFVPIGLISLYGVLAIYCKITGRSKTFNFY
ncbi:hypothetical protein A0U40_12375 [[Bacillus] sp. KCTC 13219]|nr:hypothetical protein A0U40_12375 [[Bacillus] sp. KCTC 13219]